MIHRLLTGLLFVIGTYAIANAQSFSAAVPVSKAADAHSPCMHVGPDGTIFVSWFQAKADVYFARSTDGGNTFSAPVRACRQVTDNNYTSLLQRSPEFAIDTKGTIHLVWTEGAPKAASDVWYIQST